MEKNKKRIMDIVEVVSPKKTKSLHSIMREAGFIVETIIYSLHGPEMILASIKEMENAFDDYEIYPTDFIFRESKLIPDSAHILYVKKNKDYIEDKNKNEKVYLNFYNREKEESININLNSITFLPGA